MIRATVTVRKKNSSTVFEYIIDSTGTAYRYIPPARLIVPPWEILLAPAWSGWVACLVQAAVGAVACVRCLLLIAK